MATLTQSNPKEAETLNRLCNLPRLNPNVTRLLALSASADAALEDFHALFGSDLSLAAELLRCANSVEFGQRARITSIPRALLLLGVERTRMLAATIAMGQYTRRSAGRKEVQALWSHSLATAAIAEEIGRVFPARPDHLYTAGLTHDLGRAGLLLIGGKQYLEVLGRNYENMQEAQVLEKAMLGVTHCDAGLFLAQTWQFPAVLRQCIGFHHEEATRDDELRRVVQSACFIASELGYPEIPYCAAVPPSEMIALELGLWPMQVERLREVVEKHLKIF